MQIKYGSGSSSRVKSSDVVLSLNDHLEEVVEVNNFKLIKKEASTTKKKKWGIIIKRIIHYYVR